MKYLLTAAIISLSLSSAAYAANEEDVDGGTLNPEEMTLRKSVKRAKDGDVNMVICSQGYLLTKGGSHADARAIFRECANQGYTSAMTWMSYMDDNGFGGEYDPDSAADWDRRAADAGDEMGMYNYGLDLMRGHGKTQNIELGRQYVDQAANIGLGIAKQLQMDDYDVETVTPDADNWKYAPNY
ncbi:hypothetical protein GCM10008927_03810 [Amylibacter ulvae]|uniref:Sel1 repeat family protein n=1 Tax=Paramylibacter ulvae TaxID=1651968 RepID=A0ABQ3CYP5_9RHOB|nr:sel1 repeat family protein [Amylibacter ulvae]GHA42541.1 hypothetical protein GCM10008927_03810 [Amylibacter ulvae]